MKAERLNSALTTLANIGVLVGIVAVVYELNQNTSAIVGSTQQGLLELISQSDSWLQDKEFAEIVYRAEEQKEILTGVDARRYAEWIYGKFNACEHVFEQYREGQLTEYYWQG